MEPLPSKVRKYVRNAEFWGDNDLTKWVYLNDHGQLKVKEQFEREFVKKFKETPKGFSSKNPIFLFESPHDLENIAIKHYTFILNQRNKHHVAFQKTLPSSRSYSQKSDDYSVPASSEVSGIEVSVPYRLSTI